MAPIGGTGKLSPTLWGLLPLADMRWASRMGAQERATRTAPLATSKPIFLPDYDSSLTKQKNPHPCKGESRGGESRVGQGEGGRKCPCPLASITSESGQGNIQARFHDKEHHSLGGGYDRRVPCAKCIAQPHPAGLKYGHCPTIEGSQCEGSVKYWSGNSSPERRRTAFRSEIQLEEQGQ